MHFYRNSKQFTCLNGFKVLLIVLIAYTSCVQGNGLTQEEIDNARELVKTPVHYCGKKLTDAMRQYCKPILRSKLQKKSVDSLPEFEFETFDLDRAVESYDDEFTRSRYNVDDTHYSNDIPLMFPSQGNRRRRRGIIDECCKRACYLNELVSYCPQRG